MWDFKKSEEILQQKLFCFWAKETLFVQNNFDKLEEGYKVKEKLRLTNCRFHLEK